MGPTTAGHSRVTYKKNSQSGHSVGRLMPLLLLSHALLDSSKRLSIVEVRGWTISCLVTRQLDSSYSSKLLTANFGQFDGLYRDFKPQFILDPFHIP